MSIRRLTHTGAIAVSALSFVFMGSGFTTAQAHLAASAHKKAHQAAAGQAVSTHAGSTHAGSTHAGATQSGSAQPGGLLTVPRGGGAPAFAGETSKVVSTNWGGYATSKAGMKFRFIQATFFVPYVDCANTPDSFSGHWVGFDGVSNSTAEQDGILAACQGHRPAYSAWYEMFPKPPVYPNIHITAGNSITASVLYSPHSTKYTLSLTDTTNGQRFSVTRACPGGSRCLRASTEVISEAPSSNGAVLPLTNFRSEDFMGIKVTSQGGRHGGLRSNWWRTLDITTLNGGGHVLDQPTSVFRGTAFGMYWMREK